MMKNIVELGYIYTPDKVKQPVQVKISWGKEPLESIMCDVIKIRLKRRDELRIEENRYKRNRFRSIFMTKFSFIY